MKLWDYYKIINFPKGKKHIKKTFDLIHNEEVVENIEVITYKLHSRIYRDLRAFKTSQYNIAYLMRNKKGFNTILFRINYDIVITNNKGIVLDLLINQEPGFISEYYKDGYNIYFFVVGQIKFMDIKLKDQLNLKLQIWEKIIT